MVRLTLKIYVIIFSEPSFFSSNIYVNTFTHLKYYFHISCHYLDQSNIYDKHLEQKDATYDAIMRMVKIITNFARTG